MTATLAAPVPCLGSACTACLEAFERDFMRVFRTQVRISSRLLHRPRDALQINLSPRFCRVTVRFAFS